MALSFDYVAMGQRLRELRIKAGMTQERLAEAAEISISFVGHIERGEKQCSIETVYHLACSLDASLDYLILGKKNICNRQSCQFYDDLKALFMTYDNEYPFA